MTCRKSVLREWLLRHVKSTPLVIAYKSAPNAFLPLLRAILGKSGLNAGYDMSKAGLKLAQTGKNGRICTKTLIIQQLYYCGLQAVKIHSTHRPPEHQLDGPINQTSRGMSGWRASPVEEDRREHDG